jgi:hypothetical protein
LESLACRDTAELDALLPDATPPAERRDTETTIVLRSGPARLYHNLAGVAGPVS